MTDYKNNLEYARQLDAADPLNAYRERFHIPESEGKPLIYFTGNSLGLMPKSVEEHIGQELKDWKKLGVEGHFHAKHPWFSYHHFVEEATARVVGAKTTEVVVMNALTVNLHLMMVSFYQPKGNRCKILMEAGAFPSDQYAVESQLRFHGYDYEENVIEVTPREGESNLRTEDILEAIEINKGELALVMIGGVNYYTGQFFDLEAITKAGHTAGAMVGFDLAHATGNVPLQLHDWGPDFAVWCSYKYLNAGPGGVSGVFVHERHGDNPNLPRFAGWWGNDEDTRFKMEKGFHPQQGAAGWQLSNAPVLAMAAYKASIEIFDEVGMTALRDKSEKLTGYLAFLLKAIPELTIITPEHVVHRGCQLSILTGDKGEELFKQLTEAGVVADWRRPNVIRVAPVPLYNTFEDVYRFAEIIRGLI